MLQALAARRSDVALVAAAVPVMPISPMPLGAGARSAITPALNCKILA